MKKAFFEIVRFENITPLGFIQDPFADLPIGPEVGVDVDLRSDDVTTVTHEFELTESAVPTILKDLVITNHADFGKVNIRYDLFGSSTDPIEVVLYLGCRLESDDIYLKVDTVADVGEISELYPTAYGTGVGASVTITPGKLVTVDCRYCLYSGQVYDEFIFVQKVDGINKLLGYAIYPITNESVMAITSKGL